jgi:DNA mismatch endonuclease (patch repair protein)
MRGNRKADTRPELALRSALHRAGLRYRVRQRLRSDAVAVVPDVVFTRSRVAVFVDGCWWHRCATHANTPRVNTGYWLPKLARNVERDRRVDGALTASGWRVIRIWEHDVTADVDACVRLVADVVRGANPSVPASD